MDISSVISRMVMLFIIIIIGYISAKLRIIDGDGVKKLSRLILNVTLPATILASVLGVERTLSGSQMAMLFGAAAGLYVVLGAFVLLVPPLLNAPLRDRGLYRFMTMFSNVGFMGFPVVAAIFGDEAVFYMSIFNIPFNLLTYSLGVRFITSNNDSFRFGWRHVLTPAMIAAVLAVIIYLLAPPTPALICDAASFLGQITSPAAMLIIGATLAAVPLRDVFGRWRLYIFSAIKLLVVPLAVWAIARLVITDSLILGVTVTAAAMPVATNTTLMCAEYDGDMPLASSGVFITTLFSVATIPLMIWLLFT